MIRELEKINSLHNLNIKKEDFNSFKNVKKYFDKFIKIIFIDSPTFVATLESADKYLNEDENYPYTKTCYETFRRPSDSGRDRIDAVTVARYCNLLQFVLEKIDSKSEMKFNIMDIVEPKFPRLISFLSKLSSFAADSVRIIPCDAGQVSGSDKMLTDVQWRQKRSLGNDAKYEGDLNEYFDGLHAQLSSWHCRSDERREVLAGRKEVLAGRKEVLAERKEVLAGRVSNNSSTNAQTEKDAWEKRVAEGNGEEFVEELLEQLQNECRKQSEKLFSLLHNSASPQRTAQQCGSASLAVSLYCSHLANIKAAIESYQQVAAEKHKKLGPEIDINKHLLKTNENLKEINRNREKYFPELDYINNSLKLGNMRTKPIAMISPILKVKQASKERRRSISAEESFV